MMRSKFLAALSACLCCTIMLVTAQKASATETAGCATCPGGSTETTVNVTFCSMGTSYNVDVTYCSKRYTTPQTGLACSPLRGIDEYTVIKKVCASGTALPPTDAETLTAVFCKLNPMGGRSAGHCLAHTVLRHCSQCFLLANCVPEVHGTYWWMYCRV